MAVARSAKTAHARTRVTNGSNQFSAHRSTRTARGFAQETDVLGSRRRGARGLLVCIFHSWSGTRRQKRWRTRPSPVSGAWANSVLVLPVWRRAVYGGL